MIVIRFLLGLNAAYDKCNWNVKIMTNYNFSNNIWGKFIIIEGN